jgi:tight adherence protein C
VITALILGVLCGGAAVVAYRALSPPPPPLQMTFDRLQRTDLAQISEVAPIEEGPLTQLFGRLGRQLLGFSGLNVARVEPELNLVGRTVEQHMAKKTMLGVFGLVLPSLYTVVMVLGGISVPFVLPVVSGLAFGIIFFFVPDLTLRSEAEEHRTAFRQSLGSFLDLVVIGLAGGAGVEHALRDASLIGDGWAFGQLRRALDVTAYTGETPWGALSRLGDELGISELRELAASVSLAGVGGARVRESLAAKAESLRDHALARAETEAQSATERMAFPVVMLFIGFLVLIGCPAVATIMTGI